MTATQTPPDASSEAATESAPAAAPTGLAALLGTGDHKTVGRTWVTAALIFLIGTVVSGALVSIERIDASGSDLLSDHFLQTFTAYRVSSIFLVVLPLFIGLATAVVPLQVGAPSIAFPRAAAAAMWTWLLGGGILAASYFIGGGPGGTDADAVDLWLVAWGLVIIGILLATVCVVATVIALRTPDMTLMRVPAFSWSMLVAGTLWILTLPPLLANIGLGYLDHRYGQLLFGAPDQIWIYLLWVFDQPAVYIAAIPALGLVAEIVPVVVGVSQRLRAVVVGAIAAFGVLSFGAWAQPGVSPDFVDSVPYVVGAFAIGLPVLALLGGIADSVKRGKFQAAAPAVLVVVAVALLLLGILAGAIATIDPLDLLGTTWQSAQGDLVWLASATAAIGGVLWWAPKIWGRLVPTTAGWAVAALMLVGGVLSAVPYAISGLLDQPIYGTTFDDRGGVQALNAASSVGAVIIALGALLAVAAIFQAISRTPEDEVDLTDPWGGQTLEWMAPSPPPTGNHPDGVPEVTSATPLLAGDEGASGDEEDAD